MAMNIPNYIPNYRTEYHLTHIKNLTPSIDNFYYFYELFIIYYERTSNLYWRLEKKIVSYSFKVFNSIYGIFNIYVFIYATAMFTYFTIYACMCGRMYDQAQMEQSPDC